MCSAVLIATIKDIVLIITAIAAAVVACMGLGTWKRQLKGNYEYELSRRMLVTLYKYRDAIDGVRHPAVWRHEMPSPPVEEATKMNADEIQHYGTTIAYQNRWEKVNKEKASLYPDILESKALWGIELMGLIDEVYKLEKELLEKVRRHLNLIDPKISTTEKDAIRKFYDAQGDILYDDLSDEGDQFKNTLRSKTKLIEDYLKPKLNY